jgi:Phage integrase family
VRSWWFGEGSTAGSRASGGRHDRGVSHRAAPWAGLGRDRYAWANCGYALLLVAVGIAFDAALAGTPLPPIRLHDLRHVAATLAYRATKDLKLVSQLMGHSGIQITADTYTSVFEDAHRAAAEAVVAVVPRRVAAR